MRTTLPLDDDVLERARLAAKTRRMTFRRVVNEALRAGLEAVERPGISRPYRTRAQTLGLKPGRNLDNIQELLAHAEGEDFR